jgi:uncharacterized glyoxalase superfamily protein PhnB
MKITHLVLWVQENKLSEKYYKKLGFTVEQADDDHSLMSLGGFGVNLVNMRDEDPFTLDSMATNKGKGVYLYVRVDSVDAKYHELTAQGITPATAPKEWPWDNREFIVKDPDGYKLCFWQPITKVGQS